MFLWKFELKGDYKYKKYWYSPCNISKWKSYQYLSKEYTNETITFLGKVNNKGSDYVNNKTIYLTNLYKEIESLQKEARYYYYQGWRETPGWGLHYKHLRKHRVKLYSNFIKYPNILVVNNSWKLKTHNLLKE